MYNQRVLETENGTFTPLVFSSTGGMGPECQVFMKKLAEQIATKRNANLSVVSAWIRTRTSFALLRSALVCIRRSHNRYVQMDLEATDMRIDNVEGKIRNE